MSKVVTTASTVRCGALTGAQHGGTVAVTSTARLTIGGAPVVTADGVTGKAVSGCQTPSSNSSQPCARVISVGGGLAAKLTVGGRPVVLDDLAGASDGVPPGTLAATAGHDKLTAR